MRKFAFRFEALLHLKKIEEEQALSEVAKVVTSLHVLQEKKQELSQNLQFWKEHFRSGDRSLPYANISLQSKDFLKILEKQAGRSTELLVEKQKIYTEKIKKAKTLEILKQKHYAQWKKKYRMLKSQELLDFVVGAEMRKQKNEISFSG